MTELLKSEMDGTAISERNVTFFCFVGSNQQSALAPLWFYGNAIKRLYLYYNSENSAVAGNVYSEITNSCVFSDISVSMYQYSGKDTDLESFKRHLSRDHSESGDGSEIIISAFGCSKPVFLSIILFAGEHHASIILSANYNSFEIFEDGAVRVQTFPAAVRWYLGHYKMHIYPKINAPSLYDPVFPENEFINMNTLIEDHLMESTIIGKDLQLTVDFACTTKKLLILGKMFTEEGESFDIPVRIFNESLRYFGVNCRILVYAVGDSLYARLKERLGSNKYVKVINIPDPWCLVEYTEYFRNDLWQIISKRID